MESYKHQLFEIDYSEMKDMLQTVLKVSLLPSNMNKPIKKSVCREFVVNILFLKL